MKTASFFKIHYFHVLTSPLIKHFHPDAKTGLKSYVRYENDMNLSIELSGKWMQNVFKLYRESWPEFAQVSKKVPTPRTLEPTAFDE